MEVESTLEELDDLIKIRITDIRFYRGPIFNRPEINVEKAVEAALNGQPIYGATHPLFVAYPVGVAISIILMFLMSMVEGFASWGLFQACIVLLLLCGLWFGYKILRLYTDFIAIVGKRVRIQRGLFRAQPIDLYIDKLTEINFDPPWRGFERLHYASWQPVTQGPQENPNVKHIMWMVELGEVMNGIKDRLGAVQSTHDVQLSEAMVGVGGKITTVIHLLERQISLLEELCGTGAATGHRDDNSGATALMLYLLSANENHLRRFGLGTMADTYPFPAPPMSPPPKLPATETT